MAMIQHLDLEIELIPSSCWYTNVRSNVKAATWDRMQRIEFQRTNNRCEICDGVGSNHPVELHEKWLFDDVRQIQILTGMLVLCPSCHAVKHFGLALEQGKSEEILRWLIKINHLTTNDAVAHIQKSIEIFKIRSQFQYRLELSYLKKYNLTLDKYGIEK